MSFSAILPYVVLMSPVVTFFMHKNAKMIHERALRKAGICGKKKMAFKYLNVKSYRVNRVLHYR